MSLQKSPITTHILDLDSGLPAAGVDVSLLDSDGNLCAQSTTDNDGRIMLWPQTFVLKDGAWQLRFNVDAWFSGKNKSFFFNDITLSFNVDSNQPHYHVPLLLNAFGYSTYRGS